MNKWDKFFVRHSVAFGGFGLGFALKEIGLSFIAIFGIMVAFISFLSVLMAILSVLETEES